jgi:hypothetical protein
VLRASILLQAHGGPHDKRQVSLVVEKVHRFSTSNTQISLGRGKHNKAHTWVGCQCDVQTDQLLAASAAWVLYATVQGGSSSACWIPMQGGIH